jgi:hypothetical protein
MATHDSGCGPEQHSAHVGCTYVSVSGSEMSFRSPRSWYISLGSRGKKKRYRQLRPNSFKMMLDLYVGVAAVGKSTLTPGAFVFSSLTAVTGEDY